MTDIATPISSEDDGPAAEDDDRHVERVGGVLQDTMPNDQQKSDRAEVKCCR